MVLCCYLEGVIFFSSKVIFNYIILKTGKASLHYSCPTSKNMYRFQQVTMRGLGENVPPETTQLEVHIFGYLNKKKSSCTNANVYSEKLISLDSRTNLRILVQMFQSFPRTLQARNVADSSEIFGLFLPLRSLLTLV